MTNTSIFYPFIIKIGYGQQNEGQKEQTSQCLGALGATLELLIFSKSFRKNPRFIQSFVNTIEFVVDFDSQG